MSIRGNDWLLRQAQRTLNRLVNGENRQKSGISARNLAALQRSVDSFIRRVFDKLCRRIEHDDVYQQDLNRITELKKTGADEFTSSMLTEEYSLLHRYFKVSTHYKLDLLKKYFRNYYQLDAPGHNATYQELNEYTRILQSSKSSLEGAHASVLSMLEAKVESCEHKYLSDLCSRFCSLVTRYFGEKAEKIRTCNSLRMPADQFLKNYGSNRNRKKTDPQKSRKYEQATLSNVKQEKFTRESVLSRDNLVPESGRFTGADRSEQFDPNLRNGQGSDFTSDDLDLGHDESGGNEGSRDRSDSLNEEDRYARMADELMNGYDPAQEQVQRDSETAENSGEETTDIHESGEQLLQKSGAPSVPSSAGGSGENSNTAGDEVSPSDEQQEKTSDSPEKEQNQNNGKTQNGSEQRNGSDTAPGASKEENNDQEGGVPSSDSLPGASAEGSGEQENEDGEKTGSDERIGDHVDDDAAGKSESSGQESSDSDDGIPVIDLTKFMSALNDLDSGTDLFSGSGDGMDAEKRSDVPDGARSTGKYALGEADDVGGDDSDGGETGTISLDEMLRQMGIDTDGSYDEDGVYDPHPENFWTHQYWQLGKWKTQDPSESEAVSETSEPVTFPEDPKEKYARDVDRFFNDLVDDLLQERGNRFMGSGFSDGFLTRDDRSDYLHFFSIVENNSGLQKLLQILGRQMGLDRNSSTQLRFNDRSQDKIRHPNAESMSGITMGNEISYVLPEELVKIADQDTEMFFDIGYLENNLLRFDLDGIVGISQGGRERIKSSPRKGRGPVVLCVDTSSSMQGVPESYAKATVMSLALKCHDAHRDCFVINFSVHIEKLLIREDDDEAEEKLLEFLNRSFNGGSDLDEALQECLQLMRNDPRFYRSDVLCITDGQINYSPQLADLVRRRRQYEHNRFYELVIGSMANDAYWLGATESIRSQSVLFDHLFELSTDGKWMREVTT